MSMTTLSDQRTVLFNNLCASLPDDVRSAITHAFDDTHNRELAKLHLISTICIALDHAYVAGKRSQMHQLIGMPTSPHHDVAPEVYIDEDDL